MTSDTKDPRVELSKISELLIEDLLNTPDAEIAQDATEDGSLKEAGISAKNAYQKAIQTVGAKRLQTAKAEMKSTNPQILSETHNIDVFKAREIIAKLTAANESSLTLAARSMDTISDEDAIELVNELIELGAIKKDDLF